jgi:integrase/recombinase XerD
LFYSAIKSEKTKKQYESYLDEFRRYFIIKDYDKLSQIDTKKLQQMIEDFLMYEKTQNKSKSLIAGKLSSLKLFFSMNDVVLNWDKLRKMLPDRIKTTGDVPYSTEQIQTLLKSTSNLEYRALINFLSASGVRVGCIKELRIKDLKVMPNGCKSVKVYSDTIEEYHTFIHHEAVESIKEYLESRKQKGEEITDESWVFCSPQNTSKSLPADTITSTLGRYVKKSLGREKSKSGRYSIMSCHGFRKRFNTVLKSNREINLSLAERLMGHSQKIPLDNSYFKPMLEQLFIEYQKAIPELIIDEKYKLESTIQKQQDEIDLLHEKERQVAQLQKTILQIQNNMLELQKRVNF